MQCRTRARVRPPPAQNVTVSLQTAHGWRQYIPVPSYQSQYCSSRATHTNNPHEQHKPKQCESNIVCIGARPGRLSARRLGPKRRRATAVAAAAARPAVRPAAPVRRRSARREDSHAVPHGFSCGHGTQEGSASCGRTALRGGLCARRARGGIGRRGTRGEPASSRLAPASGLPRGAPARMASCRHVRARAGFGAPLAFQGGRTARRGRWTIAGWDGRGVITCSRGGPGIRAARSTLEGVLHTAHSGSEGQKVVG